MAAFAVGSEVDLYYYGHDHDAREISGKIDFSDLVGVAILTVRGDLRFFPWSSVQQMILRDLAE